jgi:hypothetical protein
VPVNGQDLSWAAVVLAILGAVAVAVIWPAAPQVAAALVNPLIALGLP